MTELKNLNCDKAQQFLFLQDSLTLLETKLKKKMILRKRKKILCIIILKKLFQIKKIKNQQT